MSSTIERKPVGIIGLGSFGVAMTKLLSSSTDVIVYTRNKNTIDEVRRNNSHHNVPIAPNVSITDSLEEIASKCDLIFPVIPSKNFRAMMKELAPHLYPYHILIHCIKGFDVSDSVNLDAPQQQTISRSNVFSMSEVIQQESVVTRIGCLSGPNLAAEIIEGQPTAAVVASKYREVIDEGKKYLNSEKFHIFGSKDIIGAELAGAMKNVIALASGILAGKGLGKNIQAMLITRGLTEMIYFGKAMGASSQAFLGTAGIGDLIATATSSNSRNFTFGLRIAQGETPDKIVSTMQEVAEGVRTLQIMYGLAKYYRLRVPIIQTIYSIVFEGFEFERALRFLIQYPYDVDVDFM
ncbi:MAG: NAD(P)-dependent glycerol-3-phosphate dehydrogenase [Saprospiraceae bacterium]|nr:NAD(P)-dependent glycerol-3-phosphate dehydrogenase [Saprospiraceae bacterium]